MLTHRTVRKFAISIDPEEPIDFPQPVEWFAARLAPLGFEQVSTYTFRYTDSECVMKLELSESSDGYFAHLYVQAPDEHRYRGLEVAQVLEAHIIDAPSTKRHGLEE
ncbi:MAG: hypothetical protein RMM29_00105 [Planctomycetota bacterium]|nr:hypothetical protein [Planctomycetota bacterium]MCX8039271.1 hypothetical protein [Planctomycetota bacterium]MDW8372036.1 hypothetical protein [Planctomycetota bacterium]